MKAYKIIFVIVVIVVMVLFFSVNGFAFRCGSELVTSGDTRMQVLTTCGKPTSKEKSCEGRKSKKCANQAEIWYYNCGDHDYIYALTFENGILKKESTQGQGKGKSDCRGK